MNRLLAIAAVALALAPGLACAATLDAWRDSCQPEHQRFEQTFSAAIAHVRGNNDNDTAALQMEMTHRRAEAEAFLTNIGQANVQAVLRDRPPATSCADGLREATDYVLGQE